MASEEREKRGSQRPSASRQGAHDARRGRVLAQVTGSASTLLVLAIVLMANYLAFRHYERLDWTEEGLFTLSDKSEKVLRGLDQNVEIYLFLSQGESQFAEVKELLSRYQAASQKLKVHFVDPDREPGEFKVLAQRFGLGSAMTQTGQTVADVAAVVTAGEKQWTVQREDLSDVDMGSLGQDSGGPKLDVKAEQALTGAIVQVTAGRPSKICFTQGHGEWALESGEGPSLAGVKDALRHDNIELEAIETLGKEAIPERCDAVYVVGPMRAFAEEEATLLGSYVRGGGNLLLTLDPRIERDVVYPTGLEELLAGFGITLDASLLVELDPARLISQNAVEFRVQQFNPQHPITETLSAMGGIVVMHMARSVRPADGNQAAWLMKTSAQGFAETDVAQLQTETGAEPAPDDQDIQGPVSLAAAVKLPATGKGEDGGRGGRVVVMGDSDWLQRGLLESPVASNLQLLTSTTGWLTEREALISIPPKQASLGYVTFDQESLGNLFFRVVILMPFAAALLGLAVWWSRRT